MPSCPVNMSSLEHDLKSLRARRAARARALRRRRFTAALSLLAAVLVAVALATMGAAGRSPRAVVHASRGSTVRSPAVPAPSAAVVARRRSSAHLAAVRRLASYGLPVYCGGRAKRMVALTFDDGPGPYTKLALTKLREFHSRATFFLVGKEITAWPGLARLEARVAVLGDHTMTHAFLPALSHAEMVQEIARAQTLIEAAGRQPVVLFRPPYEGRDHAIDQEVKALGMLEVLWNVDSADSLGANYAGIERNVIAGLRPGSIILMHENRGQTIRALPVIFAALARRHLRAVTVAQLVAADPPSPAQLRAGLSGCSAKRTAGSGS
jgi:peptidoglycan/xylan/chitin deacetylase (PgdA/CDA1 family)